MAAPVNDPVDERVFLLSRRWSHHASHSGYDVLGKYIGTVITADPQSTKLLPDRLLQRLGRNMMGYDRMAAALELKAMRHMMQHRNCLYHVLYGEDNFNFLGHLNGWRGHKVIASFHLPPRKFADYIQRTDRLARLDGAVILGNNMASCFANILPKERVFQIPYAVETTFFTPPADFAMREENLCLFVGSHLRDFPTLCSVIQEANIIAPHISFAIVAHPNDLKQFQGVTGNFTLYSNLSEAELLALYQKATLLIEPLHDTVANTALLEGISCGLPTVITDIGASREYVHGDAAAFVAPYDAAAFLETILALLNNPSQRRAMAESARKQALRYDWQVVVQQMRELYQQLLNTDDAKQSKVYELPTPAA